MAENHERALGLAMRVCQTNVDHYQGELTSLAARIIQNPEENHNLETFVIDQYQGLLNQWLIAHLSLLEDQLLEQNETRKKVRQLTDQLIQGVHSLDPEAQCILSMRIATLSLKDTPTPQENTKEAENSMDGDTQRLETVKIESAELEDTVQGKPFEEFPTLSKKQVEEELKSYELRYRTDPPTRSHYKDYLNKLAELGFSARESDGGRQIIIYKIADLLHQQSVPFIENLVTNLRSKDERFDEELKKPIKFKALLLWSLLELGENRDMNQIKNLYNNYFLRLRALRASTSSFKDILKVKRIIEIETEKMRDSGQVFDNTPFYLRLGHGELAA